MKTRYYVEPKSGLIRAAVGLLTLSFTLRLIWCVCFPEALTGAMVWTQAALPLFACALFVFTLLKCGKTRLWLTFFPAFLGVVFFIVKATGFVWWHQLLCTLLYLTVAALYGTAVFGLAPIRKLLIPLFGLPLLFHIFIEDLIINRTVYSIAGWLQEGSVLCIMAALLCISLNMREVK